MIKLSTLWILCVVLAGYHSDLHGQKLPQAKNVNISIDQNRAIVQFDIRSKDPGKLHLVDLKFMDEDYNLVIPSLLSGDIGPGIPGGSKRSIVWDVTKDLQLFESRVTPILFIDGKSKEFSKTGGPRNAWLSLLIPGLGDYFVADHKMMKFKPYVRTITSLGLVGLGFFAGSKRTYDEAYKLYIKPDAYRFEGDDIYYKRQIKGEANYYLFKWDKEILLSAGLALWAADILWVLAKGTGNSKFVKASSRGSDFNLAYLPGGVAFRYARTF